MEYSFSPTRWLMIGELGDGAADADRFGLGLHVPRRYDRVVNVERCHLRRETASAVLRRVRDASRRSGLPPYSTRTQPGSGGSWFSGTRPHRRAHGAADHPCGPAGSPHDRAVDAVGDALAAPGFGITSLLHGTTVAAGLGGGVRGGPHLGAANR